MSEQDGLAGQRAANSGREPVPPVGSRDTDLQIDADAEPVPGNEHQWEKAGRAHTRRRPAQQRKTCKAAKRRLWSE